MTGTIKWRIDPSCRGSWVFYVGEMDADGGTQFFAKDVRYTDATSVNAGPEATRELAVSAMRDARSKHDAWYAKHGRLPATYSEWTEAVTGKPLPPGFASVAAALGLAVT